ncbi:putative leader peptide [Streptomyces sp. NPDC005892]
MTMTTFGELGYTPALLVARRHVDQCRQSSALCR